MTDQHERYSQLEAALSLSKKFVQSPEVRAAGERALNLVGAGYPEQALKIVGQAMKRSPLRFLAASAILKAVQGVEIKPMGTDHSLFCSTCQVHGAHHIRRDRVVCPSCGERLDPACTVEQVGGAKRSELLC